MLVDSHCHLDFDILRNNFDTIIHKAEKEGVLALQTICTKISDFNNILNITEMPHSQKVRLFCSIGNHPCNIEDEPLVSCDEISEICNKTPAVIGIGETGLDYHYPISPEVKSKQKLSFSEHIKAAQHTGLPIIIHTRDAEEDTIEMLQTAFRERPFKGVIHCMTGSQHLADECLSIGLYLSASGIITFKNAENIRSVFANTPNDKILVETDSPYLSPSPLRGQTNYPHHVKHVASCLSRIKGITEEEVANITTDNFFRLFNKANKWH